MSRVWNCLDDASSTSMALDGRSLVAKIADQQHLGAGITKLTIELRDSRNRPYQYVAADEAVLTVTIYDNLTDQKPSATQICSSAVQACAASHGVGTAVGDYIVQGPTIQVLVQDVSGAENLPSICYVSLGQGVGSTYFIRPARRAWYVLLAA